MWTYAPDLDERTPNILLTGSQNVVPTNAGGMRNMFLPPFATTGSGQPSYATFSGLCIGARYLLRDDGTDRLFAGTSTKIFEANQVAAFAWTDVSKGGAYSGVSQWMFDQYGATSLAAVSLGTHTEIQASTGAVGTAFANLAGAPKARIIVVQDNALYAFDYNAGAGEIYDGWIRSDTGVITTWTTGTGECVSGRFTEAPGSITAAIKQGNGIVVFKDRGMWRGQYVGLPEVVRWELVTPTVGCTGPLAVVNVDDVLYFTDTSGFWRYDGSRPQFLSEGLSSELRAYINSNAVSSSIQLGVDDYSNIISIMMCGLGSAAGVYYPFHYRTGAWGSQCFLTAFGGSNSLAVSAVCNGQFDKMHGMPGMSGSTGTVNAYWFIPAGGGTARIRNFSGSLIDLDDANAVVGFTMKPSFFGENKSGSSLTRIYHDYRSYTLSGTGTLTNAETLTAYRRPFSSGTAQMSASGNYSSGYGYTDIRATGNWFKDSISIGFLATGVTDAATVSFEWLGFEPEYSSTSRPKA